MLNLNRQTLLNRNFAKKATLISSVDTQNILIKFKTHLYHSRGKASPIVLLSLCHYYIDKINLNLYLPSSLSTNNTIIIQQV